MRAILKITAFSIFILTLTTAARAQSDVEAQTNLNILSETKITGAWRVNYAESDDAIEKMRSMLLQSKTDAAKIEKTNEKANEPPAMSVSILPPETIVLAENGNEKTITINENFSQIVYTRTVLADGVKRSGEIENGANFLIAAARKNNALKIETESPRGNRMIENYQLADRGKKLFVIVRFEDAAAKEIFTLRRVYDRISPDVFPVETEEMQ